MGLFICDARGGNLASLGLFLEALQMPARSIQDRSRGIYQSLCSGSCAQRNRALIVTDIFKRLEASRIAMETYFGGRSGLENRRIDREKTL